MDLKVGVERDLDVGVSQNLVKLVYRMSSASLILSQFISHMCARSLENLKSGKAVKR